MNEKHDKLSEIWKEKNSDILKKIYPKVSNEMIDNFLNNIIAKYKQNNTFVLRNLYKRTYEEVLIDDIPKLIKDKNLAIGANGSYTLSQKEKMAITSEFLQENIRNKDVYKELAIKAQSENDLFKWKLNQDTSDNRKSYINSTYGIQIQKGSIFYNPDSASLITTQSRTIITEMIWGLERMFSSNIIFRDLDEMFLYLNKVISKPLNKESLDYITYYPTDRDIENKIVELIKSMENRNEANELSVYLFKYLKNLTDEEKIKVYYSDDFITLILKNEKIQRLFFNILDSDIEFITTDVKDKNFPNEIKADLDLLSKLSLELSYSNVFVHDRIEKYKRSKRDVIIISDTDSAMIYIGNILTKLNPIFKHYKNDMANTYKKINTLIYMMVNMTNLIGERLIDNSMIDNNLKSFIIMKNEYLFKRMILFSTKKNYIGHEILREGKQVDAVSITGLNFSGSNIHPKIKNFIDTIINVYLMKSETINPMYVLNEIKRLENEFKNDILIKKDSLAGTRCSYSARNYDNPYIISHVRGVYIWNLLYPNNQIMPSDVCYSFPTKGIHLEDFEDIKDSDVQIYEQLKTKIFGDEKLSRYGLSMITVPEITESFTGMPDWLVSKIDIWKIINKHINPLYRFMTSINLKINTINSKEITSSNILLL